MRISVIGAGYVGTVTSACLADSGHYVMAVDTDLDKVQCLQEGRTPIIEKDLSPLVKKGHGNGSLTATTDTKQAVLDTEITLVCVGTPNRKDGSLDLAYVETVCRNIGAVLKEKEGFHTVVLRSTMLPGSAEDVCLPLIESASEKKAGKDFGFGNNPEFLREGSAIDDYYNPPKIVVGTHDDKTAAIIMSLYENIEAPRVVTDIRVAEGVKYADNAWHAMKVGFANELGNIFKECGIDSHKVMDIFCLDTKLNISSAYLKPGFAFGGSCLPKDVRAIRAKGKGFGLQTPIFDALLDANERQIQRALTMIKAAGKKNIGMLGLSFKSGTADLRESPLVTLADHLLKDGYTISIYDPNVFRASRDEGSPDKKHIAQNIPHISAHLVETAEELKSQADMLVIGNNSVDFAQIIRSVDNDNMPVIDLVRLHKSIEDRTGYDGICW